MNNFRTYFLSILPRTLLSIALLAAMAAALNGCARAVQMSRSGLNAEHEKEPEAAGAQAMFRNGPAHAGVYESPELTGFGGLQWRVQTGGTVRSSPVLADGVAYVGSSDGLLYAVDAATGAERWTLNAQSAISSTPAVANGTIYFGTRDGTFRAVRASTGEVVWSIKTGPDAALAWGYESGDHFTSSPTVIGERVLFGSGDGFLYAVRRTGGRELWKLKTGGRVRSSPAVAGGVVFVGSFDGALYAVELESGKLKWRYETEGAKLDSAQFGFDRKSIQSSPAVANGAVFFGARDGFLYAVSATDGQLLWRFDHEVSWVNGSPAVADEMVYAGSSDGKFIQGVEARTGKEVWRFKTDGIVWTSPALDARMLYAGDSAGNLYALDRRTGHEAWRYHIQSKIFSSAAINAGRLYFGSDDGGIYALNSAQAAPLKRAVFWDAGYTKVVSFQGHEELRDYFKECGYEVLDAQALAAFLTARLSDHAPSVIVFAIDYLPQTLNAGVGESSLLRKYLEAGGKVVWPGIPPLLWPRELQTGERDITKIDRRATERLLGVGHQKGNFDTITSRVTAQGIKWGLGGWWSGNWAAEPESVTAVLAEDEQGQAAAWVRRYQGPEGTGFVRLPVLETIHGKPTNLLNLQIAAEYLPR